MRNDRNDRIEDRRRGATLVAVPVRVAAALLQRANATRVVERATEGGRANAAGAVADHEREAALIDAQVRSLA